MNERRVSASLCLAGSIALGALLFAIAPATSAQTPQKTLRIVPQADIKILDPTFTTAYISRNFGYMVYDTLFALDAKDQPQPQMVDTWKVSPDNKLWTFTLRPGLRFSDGSAVTSADAVASMRRWMSRDSIGRQIASAGGQWTAVDARTFTLTLQQPLGIVLDGLARASAYPTFVLPERLATLPTTSPLPEVLGSGPYMFKRDEWVPGNKVVFVKNPYYVARSEPPSGLAGSKAPHVDRVEWLYLPDANSSVAALKSGEVDYIEQAAPDYIAPLRADTSIKVGASGSSQGWLVMNELQPPFNNPLAREAVMMAVDQARFTTAMGYPADLRLNYCPSFFMCGTANETAAGSAPFAKPDLAKAKQLLAQAGYQGEKVVVLVPSDMADLNAAALVAVQTLTSIGMNVDAQTMDWSSIAARRTKRTAADAGGWSVYVTMAGMFDVSSPVTNGYLSAACDSSLPGWPCDKQLDDIRNQWIHATDPAQRKRLLDAFQTRAYAASPYANYGQFSAAYAVRRSVTGTDKLWGGIPMAWVLNK
jgi:peptide/nickel transport system substrate-binding protein